MGSGNYSEEAVLGNTCEYELTGLNRGLKTESDFYQNTAQGSASWTLNHFETYSYDGSNDYLTGANYGDGLANATPSWSYDAASNRTDSVVDNLNRTTSINGISTTCDILGNRQTLGSSTSYGWDCLNRMTSYQDSSGSSTYAYRADGMRVGKSVGSSGTNTVYCYDGQVGFEDTSASSSQTTVTDYGLGARGIDYISAHNSTTVVGFPIYDAHGNMVACLERSGSTYYSLSNQRSYDAWGTARQGSSTGDPQGRYCANLGHKQDDESTLIYMRARFYDPRSARFMSEDPNRHGLNFFAYCSNKPILNGDTSGKDDDSDADSAKSWEFGVLIGGLLMIIVGAALSRVGQIVAMAGLLMLVAWFNLFNTATNLDGSQQTLNQKMWGGVLMVSCATVLALCATPDLPTGICNEAIGAVSAYGGVIMAFIGMENYAEGY